MEQVAAGNAQLLGALLQSAVLPGVRQTAAATAEEGALAAASQAAAARQLSVLQQRQRQLSSSSPARTPRSAFAELSSAGDTHPEAGTPDTAPCPVSPRTAQTAEERPAARRGSAEEDGTPRAAAAGSTGDAEAGAPAEAGAAAAGGGGSSAGEEGCGGGDPEWIEAPGGLPGGAGLPGTAPRPRLQVPLTAVSEPDLALELCTLLMLMERLRPGGGALPELMQLPRQERELLTVYALFLFAAAGALRTRSRRQLMKKLLSRQRQQRRGGRQLRDHPAAAFHEAMLGG